MKFGLKIFVPLQMIAKEFRTPTEGTQKFSYPPSISRTPHANKKCSTP